MSVLHSIDGLWTCLWTYDLVRWPRWKKRTQKRTENQVEWNTPDICWLQLLENWHSMGHRSRHCAMPVNLWNPSMSCGKSGMASQWTFCMEPLPSGSEAWQQPPNWACHCRAWLLKGVPNWGKQDRRHSLPPPPPVWNHPWSVTKNKARS